MDFKNRRIRVNHQLQRTNQMKYIIEKPKTESGERYVPMSDDVIACFKRILKMRKNPQIEPMVDGLTGFLFLDKNDRPMVEMHWEKFEFYSSATALQFYDNAYLRRLGQHGAEYGGKPWNYYGFDY